MCVIEISKGQREAGITTHDGRQVEKDVDIAPAGGAVVITGDVSVTFVIATVITPMVSW